LADSWFAENFLPLEYLFPPQTTAFDLFFPPPPPPPEPFSLLLKFPFDQIVPSCHRKRTMKDVAYVFFLEPVSPTLSSCLPPNGFDLFCLTAGDPFPVTTPHDVRLLLPLARPHLPSNALCFFLNAFGYSHQPFTPQSFPPPVTCSRIDRQNIPSVLSSFLFWNVRSCSPAEIFLVFSAEWLLDL